VETEKKVVAEPGVQAVAHGKLASVVAAAPRDNVRFQGCLGVGEAPTSIEEVVGDRRWVACGGNASAAGGRWMGPEGRSYHRETDQRKAVVKLEANSGGKPIARKITEKKKVSHALDDPIVYALVRSTCSFWLCRN
jgi:hypothetical protein